MLFGFECPINLQSMITIVGAIFEKKNILHFFLILPLILRVDRKREKRAGDICKGALDIAFERNW